MGTGLETRFERYGEAMATAMGHADLAAPTRWYLQGLLLPGGRKSVEPMAARVRPQDVPSTHQSMHHLVSTSAWSDKSLVGGGRRAGAAGAHARGNRALLLGMTPAFHCGQTGKTDNCQTHLETKAFFHLPAVAASTVDTNTVEVVVRTRGDHSSALGSTEKKLFRVEVR